MEPQQPSQPPFRRPSHPRLHSILPPPPSHLGQSRTANSTPVSPPGLFSPSMPRPNMVFPSQPGSETATPGGLNSPYLHPLQGHKVRETHKANVEHDYTTGRKHINNYEIIEELGRGVHGKVKLARNVENGEFVAIKIIPRFSKKRRLGKVTAMSTQDKSKKEIAILKKIRHPNVVALLEVIDDPELKKIYMVLEHVELGEVVWRKKGLPHICEYERRRIEREKRGAKSTPEEDRFERALLRRQAAKAAAQRASLRARAQKPSGDYWSLEYGPADDEELDAHVGSLGRDDPDLSAIRPALSNSSSLAGSRATSRAPSRSQSVKSLSRLAEPDVAPAAHDGDLETPGALPIKGKPGSSTALDGTMYGPYADDPSLQGRSPSMADSLISHISSFDFNRVHDPFVDDFSYVPCFTIEQARNTFRDTVLGLEYLHYEGVVHRDIKPANLLWTKDKRTKIADFGVSYFGRPVRDGEPDDTISESEARDFDDDFELAKTVGTPAFFAPELCATDLYDAPPGKQPKVTEQIDVWSLGVTLYCLIYARLPFLAEDEWQMFKKIANEEVYIPDRRLRPVDPATKPSEKSLYTRLNKPPYRNDDELAYEDIEPELQDLLKKMLTKDPEKRIRLRDVKRHPWVMHGVDVMSWIDDTDPSRRASGKRIQVDEKDMARAVVPLSLMERARSVVKKAVGKVMHPRGDRTDSASSRRRATSSAASSAGDITGLITPHLRDSRRKSLRPDDYFSSPSQQPGGHPLTHSVLASPETGSPPVPSPLNQASPAGGHASRRPLELLSNLAGRDDGSRRRQSGSPHRGLLPRHGQSRSITNAFLALTPSPIETLLAQSATPFLDSPSDDPIRALRKARDTKPHSDEPGRARSVDRGLFASDDKRAEVRVSLSTAVAPGNIPFAVQPHPPRSTDPGGEGVGQDASTAARPAPGSLSENSPGQSKPDPDMRQVDEHGLLQSEKRPVAAQVAEAVQKPSTPEPTEPALVPCPPSPDDETLPPLPPSRGDTATGPSSSSTSVGALTTPMTSPSESASPIYGLNNQMTKEVADRMLAFQSDPSLPALLSSTSSVSADPEGEFLGHPGFVGRSAVVDTTDSLTPPAFAKEPMSGFPLEAQDLEGAVPVKLDKSGVFAGAPAGGRFSTGRRGSRCRQHDDDEGDNDSDSDEGLTMARRKKKPAGSSISTAAGASSLRDMQVQTHGVERLVRNARRRDTTTSVDSTETAKKMSVDND
ncbi:kinase-like protein [Thermothelomyces heterothallicus CBS 203.75]